ncbi:retrotransposon protein, putative, ty1-copia subclass [Tanacetum coccineum]
MIVMKADIKSANLYHLRGTTIIGGIGKLDPRAIKCIFLGYKSGVKGYKLWCPETEKHTSSGHFGDQDTPIVEEDSGVAQQPQRFIATDRARRTTKAPSRLIEEVNLITYALNVAEDIEGNMEPSTYSEAIISTEFNKWLTAMHDEMESLDKNGTWELVKFPEEKKPIKCKWIFKRKEGITPSKDVRFKARLLAKGFSQIPGIDFTDVFSPVVKHSSIHTLLSIVAMHDYELEQLDVKTTFLHGELEEDIYMEQPEGFVIPRKENLVCKLKKSLYGLKKSSRQWYKRFDTFMLSQSFKISDYDSCVYLKFVNGSPIYLLLYVDDMLIATKDKAQIEKLKGQLSNEFDMKDLGATKKILGMEIIRERQSGKLYLSQQGYVEKRYVHSVMSKVPYSSAVGSLMYAMVCSRPDLSYALSVVSRYMADPGKKHGKAVQWIFRYLHGTSNVCLEFEKSKYGLVGYVDSDYADDLDKRRSLIVEYMVISEACKEAIWLINLFNEFSGFTSCTTIFCDSQSAIYLTKDQMNLSRHRALPEKEDHEKSHYSALAHPAARRAYLPVLCSKLKEM